MFYKVKDVNTLEDFILMIEFKNGIMKTYDVKPLFEKCKVFQTFLHIDNLFSTVKVDMGGYGITWNDNIDLSCNELWENGILIDDSKA